MNTMDLEKLEQKQESLLTKSEISELLKIGRKNTYLTDDDILAVIPEAEHDIDMLTLGQYLQPSREHMPVQRYVHPDVFAWFAEEGLKMGFKNVASGPLVRSSYHADQQAHEVQS